MKRKTELAVWTRGLVLTTWGSSPVKHLQVDTLALSSELLPQNT